MLLMWLCEVGRLSLEIGSAHVLDWTKYLATKQYWISVASSVLFPDFQ